jgi:outer membrane protein
MRNGFCIAGVFSLGCMLAGCGLQKPSPFDPNMMQRTERDDAAQTTAPPMPPLPTGLEPISTTEPASQALAVPSTGQAISQNQIAPLQLQDIIQRSVANSAEVRVAGYDPAVAETKVLQAQGAFDPIFFTNASFQYGDQKTAGQAIVNPQNPLKTEIIDVQRSDQAVLEPGVKQLLPNGGQASISYQGSYNRYDPRLYTLNDYWENTLKFELTQPLLRDFGRDVTYAKLTVARYDQRVSLLDFRKTLEDNVEKLEEDYWQLSEAQKDVEVQEKLLQTTRDTADVLFKQFVQGEGGISRVQTSQAAASMRAREAALIGYRQRIRDLSTDIKRRMNDPEFPVDGPVVIVPASDPTTDAIHFDPKEMIDTALANRLELGQQELRISAADVQVLSAKNGLLPQLNMKLDAGVQSLGQHEWSAFNGVVDEGHFPASVGFELEIPIGNVKARGAWREALLEREQAIEQYRNLISQVSEDVTVAYNDVISSWQAIASRRAARYASADELEVLDQQQAAGVQLTPTFVQLKLDSQDRLAEAERQETLAVSNYNIAIAHLEKAKGTLLRYNNVLLAEQPLAITH